MFEQKKKQKRQKKKKNLRRDQTMSSDGNYSMIERLRLYPNSVKKRRKKQKENLSVFSLHCRTQDLKRIDI